MRILKNKNKISPKNKGENIEIRDHGEMWNV